MPHREKNLTIIGGGLAGSEAAWQAAQRGILVDLYEMRPALSTGAHISPHLAELVCSNSLGSNLSGRATGTLKFELNLLNSVLLECAEKTALPAGGALAVDREKFAGQVTERISSHPNIHLIRQEVTSLPEGPTLITSGPLTSPTLAAAIQNFTGQGSLYFYDAIAPIVAADSIDRSIAFRASRFDMGEQPEGDYINCPFNQEEYQAFIAALTSAERITLKEFEQDILQGVKAGYGQFFEGCLPIEVMAARGADSLSYGPMRPVGLRDPRTGRWPTAVAQLRQDNLQGTAYNIVGFQTNLTYPEQERVFRMIPGLQQAEFIRHGQMHRNTFIAAPLLLEASLQSRTRADLFFAGQIVGVEGYMGNIATGALAGINAARYLHGKPLLELPKTTILGSLCHYITHASLKFFQPTKANFNIIAPLEIPIKNKRERFEAYTQRAVKEMQHTLESYGELIPAP